MSYLVEFAAKPLTSTTDPTLATRDVTMPCIPSVQQEKKYGMGKILKEFLKKKNRYLSRYCGLMKRRYNISAMVIAT
ncbi:unnamed protein product [Brassica oleracea var. botrytis]